jgi:hypothetical protein
MKPSDIRLLNGRTKTPVPLTRMGFGGAPLGNLYRKVSEEDAQAALLAAYEVGVRYFDAATISSCRPRSVGCFSIVSRTKSLPRPSSMCRRSASFSTTPMTV